MSTTPTVPRRLVSILTFAVLTSTLAACSDAVVNVRPTEASCKLTCTQSADGTWTVEGWE